MRQVHVGGDKMFVDYAGKKPHFVDGETGELIECELFVAVLGWNEKQQKQGTFANSFTDQNKGKQISQAFVQQGADIIFPVAGGTGLGSGAAAQSSGGR